MIKRTIIISSPIRASLRNNQLLCEGIDDSSIMKCAPIEDIGVVLVNNQRATFTIPLINKLADNNVALVFCDEKGIPSSSLYSMVGNTTQGETHRAQLSAKKSLNNQLWKQIIEAKIRNQSRLLTKIGKDGNLLRPLYLNVKTGDSDNREGVAAKLYWRELFGEDFIRDRSGNPPNNMLNYGYSILRSATARSIIGSGLLLSFGIYHKNRYNAMPLADDVMEPFRPFVDKIVYDLILTGHAELSADVKKELLNVLICDTCFNKVKRPLELGLSMMTSSLCKSYIENEIMITPPKLE